MQRRKQEWTARIDKTIISRDNGTHVYDGTRTIFRTTKIESKMVEPRFCSMLEMW